MMDNRNYNTALPLIEQVLWWDPLNTTAHSYRAFCFKNLENPSMAIAYANNALQIDPYNMLALFTKAQCCFGLGQFYDSYNAYETMRAIDPTDLNAIEGKIKNLFYLNKWQCLQTIEIELLNSLPWNHKAEFIRIKLSLQIELGLRRNWGAV